MPNPITLILVEDTSGPADAAALLRAQPEFRVLAASADFEAVLRLARESGPDVVLLQLASRTHACVKLVAALREDAPRSRVIVMGMKSRGEDVVALVRAGVTGFLMADADFDQVLRAIRLVAQGTPFLPAELAHGLFGQLTRRRWARASLQNPSIDGWMLSAAWSTVPA